jgi:hypothetical protein
MHSLTRSPRVAYIHIGTHKTGTTSLQAMLGANSTALRDAGVYVPMTGRIDRGFGAHHNIAWELGGDPRFDPRHGTIEALWREIDAANAPAVCISSEDFELLHVDPAAMELLRVGFLALGYQPTIVLWLRPQADYLESLYATLVRHWDVAFDDFFEKAVTTGAYGPWLFDYARLTAAFAGTFGHDHLIVRPYQSSAPSAILQREFVALVAPELAFKRLTLPRRLNGMATFGDVVAQRARQLQCSTHYALPPKQRFDPLSLLDIARVMLRFADANQRVERLYGARIGLVTPVTFAREVIAELLRDRASRFRKRLIRSLVANDLDVAA